ncbi:hypothetical protein E2C01_038669 [Portunus trituberculatus]|uniref:Uncharacterized protein n=1 Tax=Portunus trituberculatus TaxID=210409 RepID=A0A5B7FHK4_PORTR|nr:hypothetical protein [Portunus trituberculatus]
MRVGRVISTDGGVGHGDRGPGLEVLTVLLVSVVDLLARYVCREVHGRRLARLVGLLGGVGVGGVAGNIALQEGGGVLVGVQGEGVGRLLSVVAVNSWSDAVHHDVFPDGLELVVGAVLQVEEGIQAHLLALEHI